MEKYRSFESTTIRDDRSREDMNAREDVVEYFALPFEMATISMLHKTSVT